MPPQDQRHQPIIAPTQNALQPTTPQMVGQSKTNVMAILSLVFSVVFVPLGFIFGIVALVQIKKTRESGKILAVIGLVVSVLQVLFAIGIVVYTFSQIDLDSDQEERVQAISQQAEVFYVEYGSYPPSLEREFFPLLDQSYLSDDSYRDLAYVAFPQGCDTECSSYRIAYELFDGIYAQDSLFTEFDFGQFESEELEDIVEPLIDTTPGLPTQQI